MNPKLSPRNIAAKFLRYGSQVEIKTPLGPRLVRSAEPTLEFWHAFHGRAEEFRKDGVTVRMENDKWVVREWTLLPGSRSSLDLVRIIRPRNAVDIHPPILKKLLPWQPEPVRMAVNGLTEHRTFLDASDMGVGKTAVAVAACAQMKLRPVVVCNKKATHQWWWMLEHFGFTREDADVGSWTMIRTGKTSLGKWKSAIFIDPKDPTKKKTIRRFHWEVPAGSVIIFDEIHKGGGGRNTQQGMMVVAAKRQGFYCMGLSATAATTPLRMEALGYMLGLFSSPLAFIPWTIEHGCRRLSGQRGFVYEGGDAAMRRIHRAIFDAGKGVRLSKKDIPDFPQNVSFVEAIDFDETELIAQQYDAIKQVLIRSEGKMISRREANDAILRARQHIELLKIPTLVEMIDEAMAEGNSCICFVNFRETARLLSAELTCPMIIGGLREEVAVEAHRGFQDGRYKAIVMTYGSGSESMDFHDTKGDHPRYVLHNPHYSAINTRQATGRPCRAGGKSKTIQKFIFAAGTVEVSVMESSRAKLRNIDILNDGDLVPLLTEFETYS